LGWEANMTLKETVRRECAGKTEVHANVHFSLVAVNSGAIVPGGGERRGSPCI
jgi:hypothetical protein